MLKIKEIDDQLKHPDNLKQWNQKCIEKDPGNKAVHLGKMSTGENIFKKMDTETLVWSRGDENMFF